MLSNLYQTPASARAKYALEALTGPSGGGNPLRKGVMVALMAIVAGGLIIALPDGDEDVVAVQADGGAADGVVIDDAPAATDDSDVSEGSADEAAAAAQVAVGTEAALSGMEHDLRNGMVISAGGEVMSGAKAAADELQANATVPTTVPAVAAPSKAKATTTAAPATTAAPSSSSDPAVGGDASGDESTSTSGGEGETTTTTGESTSSSDSTDGSSSTSSPDTTAAPETTVAPDTTAPETTVPAPTSGTAGWVDTGNGVLVPPILLEIRRCESTDNYTEANPSSSARGAYQFLTGSWQAYGHRDRYGVTQAHLATPAQQDEAALITWQQDGTRPWNASRSCWG